MNKNNTVIVICYICNSPNYYYIYNHLSVMGIIAVSLQGNIWHPLTSSPDDLTLEFSKIFHLRIFFRNICYSSPFSCLAQAYPLIECSVELDDLIFSSSCQSSIVSSVIRSSYLFVD